MKMNMKEALEARVGTINEELVNNGERFRVTVREVQKNGTMKIGLTCISDEYNCSPTIYPDENLLERSDVEIARAMADFYNRNAKSFDVMQYMERSYIEKNVLPRIESEKNMMYLKREGFACRSYLDFVISYAVVLDDFDKEGIASVKLTSYILEQAGISLDEIHEMAMKNLEKDIQVDTMWNMLSGLMGEGEVPEDGFAPMWVMTNSKRMYGAAALLSNSTLQKISDELGSDLIILPSSVNEVIIMKRDDKSYDMEMMLQMVRDVNEAVVSADEKLTDNCYMFSCGELTSYI